MSDFEKGLKKMFFLVLAFLFLVSNISYAYPDALRIPIGQKDTLSRLQELKNNLSNETAEIHIPEQRISVRVEKETADIPGSVMSTITFILDSRPNGPNLQTFIMRPAAETAQETVRIVREYLVNLSGLDLNGNPDAYYSLPVQISDLSLRSVEKADIAKASRGAASIDGYIDAETHNRVNRWLAKNLNGKLYRKESLENKLGLSGLIKIYIVPGMLKETGVIGHYGIRNMSIYLDETAYSRLGEDLFYHELTEYAMLIRWALKDPDGSLKPDIERLCNNYELMLGKDPEKAIQFLREAKNLPELSVILEKLVEWLDRTGGATAVVYSLKVIHKEAYPIKGKYEDFLRYAAYVEKNINSSLPDWWYSDEMQAGVIGYLNSLCNGEKNKEIEGDVEVKLEENYHGVGEYEYFLEISYKSYSGSKKYYPFKGPISHNPLYPSTTDKVGFFVDKCFRNRVSHFVIPKNSSLDDIKKVLLKSAGLSEKYIDLDAARPVRGAAGLSEINYSILSSWLKEAKYDLLTKELLRRYGASMNPRQEDYKNMNVINGMLSTLCAIIKNSEEGEKYLRSADFRGMPESARVHLAANYGIAAPGTIESALANLFNNTAKVGTTSWLYDALAPYVRPGKKVTITEMIEMLRKKDVVDLDTDHLIPLDSPKVIAAIKLILKDRGLLLEEDSKPEAGEIKKEAQNSIVDRSVISDRARNVGGKTAGEVLRCLEKIKETGVKIRGVSFAGQLRVYSLDEAISYMRMGAENGFTQPYVMVRDYISDIRLGITNFEISIYGLGDEYIRAREIDRDRNSRKTVNNNL